MASAITAMVIVSRGTFSDTDGRVLGTAGALAGFIVLTLPSLVHWEHGRYRPLAAAAIAASLVSFALLVVLIWRSDLFEDTSVAKTLGTIGIVAFAANHISLILLARPRGGLPVAACMAVTTAVVIAVAAMLVTAIWGEVGSQAFWRLAAILIILDILGTITVPLLARTLSPQRTR
ncbi:MAG: hypothetical protein V3V35_04695 [Dehalococcoidia bacterium]